MVVRLSKRKQVDPVIYIALGLLAGFVISADPESFFKFVVSATKKPESEESDSPGE